MRVGDGMEVLHDSDDLKASMTSIGTAETIHEIVKNYASSVRIVINTKKSAVQLNFETPLPESLQVIPRTDEIPYLYLGFEMKKGEVDIKGMMKVLEKRGSRRSWRSRYGESTSL